MPRKARVVFPGLTYHIVQRGNYRENIFDDELDKQFYLKHLHRYRKQFRIKLYAWCLMDNHVHLILEPSEEDSLHQLFRRLNVKYSHYINKKRGKKGRLWEDRYYSSCMDEQYFLYVLKYVELNPYRAYMEKSLGVYPWTSYQERTLKVEYRMLDDLPHGLMIKDWRQFILDGLKEEERFREIRELSSRNLPLGSNEFLDKLEDKSGLELRPRPQGRPSI